MPTIGDILSFSLQAVSRIPFEKLMARPMDTSKDLKKLEQILRAPQPPTNTAPEPEPPANTEEQEYILPVRNQPVKTHAPPIEGVSAEETVNYQKRELCKELYLMEKQYSQKLRINGRVCDCGAGKHLLGIEGLAEETVSMVDDSGIYYRIIDWVRTVGPISTPEAAATGRYDEEYPKFSLAAREFRKELLGTLDVKAMWGKTPELLRVTEKEEVNSEPSPANQ